MTLRQPHHGDRHPRAVPRAHQLVRGAGAAVAVCRRERAGDGGRARAERDHPQQQQAAAGVGEWCERVCGFRIGCHFGDQGLNEICQGLVESNNFSLALLNVMDNDITAQGMTSLKLLFDYGLFQIKDLSLASRAARSPQPQTTPSATRAWLPSWRALAAIRARWTVCTCAVGNRKRIDCRYGHLRARHTDAERGAGRERAGGEGVGPVQQRHSEPGADESVRGIESKQERTQQTVALRWFH